MGWNYASAPPERGQDLGQLVNADDPPLRFALGATVLPMTHAVYAERIAIWEAREATSNAAQGGATKGTVTSF